MIHTPTFRVFLFLFLSPFFFSCGNVSKVAYFNNIQDSVIRTQTEALDAVIDKADILSIAVTSLNPEASAMFNMPNLPGGTIFASSANSSLSATAGYIVNEDGYIQFPVLGQLKAEGLTKKQLALYIKKELVEKKLLLDPIVGVRQLNFHVTVLGEVARPTVVNVPNEKINILEAIGLAGDLTLYGNRDNVLLIREEGGEKIVRRIDLHSSKTLSSPYYNLRSGDVIYVEPNQARVNSTKESRQILPIVLSGLSLLVIAIDRFVRN